MTLDTRRLKRKMVPYKNYNNMFRWWLMLFLPLLGCTNMASSELHGLWSLVIMERQTDKGWEPVKDGYQGYLLYEATGHMALHLLPRQYQFADSITFHSTFSVDSMSLPELRHRAQSYVYMGSFTQDANRQTVSHKRLSHVTPTDWGQTVTRHYRFHNDTLIITPDEPDNAGLRLKWLKVK